MDAVTGKKRRSFGHHESRLLALAFAPDGKAIASTSVKPRPGWGPGGGRLDTAVQVWDTATGTRLRRFEGHQDVVRAIAFSADGGILASGSDDGTALIWDVRELVREGW